MYPAPVVNNCTNPLHVMLPDVTELATRTDRAVVAIATVSRLSCFTLVNKTLAYTWTLVALDSPPQAISVAVVAALAQSASTLYLQPRRSAVLWRRAPSNFPQARD